VSPALALASIRINPPAPPAFLAPATLKSRVEWTRYGVLGQANRRTVVAREEAFPAIHSSAIQDDRKVDIDTINLQYYTRCSISDA
jgi:hypothetical protein